MKRAKRKVTETDVINRNELMYRLQELGTRNTLRDRALISFLFLTGARISEVVRSVRKLDLQVEELNGEQFMVVYNVQCLKRKANNSAKRNIPIHVMKEKDLMQHFYVYVKTLGPEEVLFPISRQQAYNIVRKFMDKAFPHYFRHLRLTDLSRKYGFNSSELRQYTGWTDDKPAAHYVHLNWRDTAAKMTK